MVDSEDQYVSAGEAAELLGVKRETLYAYVSRGLLESVPNPESSRSRLYRRADLQRLQARADARAGEGPVAAGALRWGAPVLETSICEVTEEGPSYRGRPLRTLVADAVSFERVAELLWSGELLAEVGWELATVELRERTDDAELLDVIRHSILDRELQDSSRVIPGAEASHRHARSLLTSTVASIAHARHLDIPLEDSFAAAVAVALGAADRAQVIRAIDTAMVVSAEHELNASAFAARVAASTGANVYACVTAALAAFSGPRHGGTDARIRRLLEDVRRSGARETILRRLQAGEALPGFGQPLYPDGDPRFDMLWTVARQTDLPDSAAVFQLVEAAAELAVPPPTLDLGLAAVVAACQLPRGSAAVLFALGRMAGWVAHALEQAEQGFLLRPRARYVGSAPE